MSTVGKGSQYFSGFAPTSIPGCGLWLDAADSNTFTLSGSNVTQWRDKSGNSRNFSTDVSVAPPGAVPPTYGTSNVNNLPVVSFSNQSLWAADFFTATQSFTVFFVGTSTIARGFDNYGNGWSFGFPITTGEHLVFVNNGPAGYAMNPNPSNSALWSATVSQTTTSVVNFWNGGTLAASSNINNTGLRTSTLGFAIGTYHNVTFFRNGYIGEVIIYTVALDAFQRQAVEGYLANKWDMTIPSTHPLKRAALGAPPFTPTTYPGCALWLDAADSSTLTLSGTNVTQWRDKSGNARHGTGNPSSNLPTYSAASNAIVFNSNYFATTYSTVGSNQTTFVVFYPTVGGGTDSRPLYSGTNAVNGGMVMFHYNGWPGAYNLNVVTHNVAYGAITSNNSAPLSNTYIGALTISNSNSMIFLNGSSNGATPSNMSGFSNTTVWIAASANNGNPFAYYIGQIKEVISYSNPLTTNQRQAVEFYLANKWGLTSSIPAPSSFTAVRPFLRPFVPVDISGCVMWLDAADSTAYTLSGSNVTAWRDKSPNSTVLTLSNGSGGSTIVTTFNGRPVIQFSNSCFFNATYSYPLATRSIFFVVAEVVHANYRGLVNFANTTGQSDFNTSNGYTITSTNVTGSPVEFAQNAGNGGFSYFYPVAGTLNVPFSLYEDVTSNTAASIFVNGSNVFSTTTSVTPATSTGFTVAGRGGQPSSGTLAVAEVLLFNRAITSAERQQVETYMVNKWGLRGSTPSNHPARLAPALTPQFNPLFVNGCALWLDAADPSTYTLTSGNMTRWTDKSSNAYSCTPVAGNTITTATRDGKNVFFLNNAVATISSFAWSNQFTLLMVTQTDALLYALRNNGYVNYVSIPNYALMYLNDQGRSLEFKDSVNAFGVPIQPSNAYSLLSIGYSSGTSANNYTVNGTPRATTLTNGTAQGAGTNTFPLFINGIETGSFGAAFVAEIIHYNTSLTTAQRQAVEGYLAAKWGLANSLPNGHPFKTAKP